MSEDIPEQRDTREPTRITDNHTVFVGSKPFMKFR